MSELQSSESEPLAQGVRVAIIGVGGCFPGAQNTQAFWDNICAGHVAIGPVPKDRWDPALYYSKNPKENAKTYCQLGGFLPPVPFDRKKFRIPPKTLASIDDVQKLALTVVAQALADAGLEVFPGDGGRAFSRERTAVVLGNAMGGEFENLTCRRVAFPTVAKALEGTKVFQAADAKQQASMLADFEKAYKADLPPLTEDTMPGELSNCISGRVANALDLRGPNFTTDAACAASMAAVYAGCRGLTAGDYDVAVVGGVDRRMDPPTYVKFCRIGALSPDHSAPFDASANGFVMGEGGGALILKRLDDAVRDGDNVYAVIEGLGAASDGRGKGMTAPNPRGQSDAVKRAYVSAGVGIENVGLFEAHGTSTVVGDGTEAKVLTDMLRASGQKASEVPVGSVKSMIGHLKSAAGAASLVKVAYALREKVLPPSAGFSNPPADSPLREGFLKVNTHARPWASASRRFAGVSAFGFGGTNFHFVLGEFDPNSKKHFVTPKSKPNASALLAAKSTSSSGSNALPRELSRKASPVDRNTLYGQIVAIFAEHTGYGIEDFEPSYALESDLGIDTVKQAEILATLRKHFALSGAEDGAGVRLADLSTLDKVVDYVAGALPGQDAAPATQAAQTSDQTKPKPEPSKGESKEAVWLFEGNSAADAVAVADQQLQDPKAQSLQGGALLLPQGSDKGSDGRLAFVAASLDEARAQVGAAKKRKAKILAAQGIFVQEGARLADSGKVAFLFPGQGSQYVGMLEPLAERYPVVRQTFLEAEEILLPVLDGVRLTDIVWPKVRDAAADARLRETQNCQPAMLAADVALLRLLAQHGLKPDLVAGHSLGEYAACVAAGVMSFADALFAVSARGREMSEVKVADNGKMAVVAGDAASVERVLAQIPGYVIAANKNCHTQTVIAGASDAVVAAVKHFAILGMDAKEIPVSHAFHCEIVAPASVPLGKVLQRLDIQAASLPILSNVDASYYPTSKDEIIALLAKQAASPVEFIAQIERMYRDGARTFIEVGPRRAITGFVSNVLADRSHRALFLNHHKKPAVRGYLEGLAALASDGQPVALPAMLDTPVAAQSNAAAADTHETAHTSAADLTMSWTQKRVGDAAVVVSGTAALLPLAQPVPDVAHDQHMEAMLDGLNCIEPVSEDCRQAMLDKNVVRLNKSAGDFESLQRLDQVVQLAARLGPVDLVADYGVDPGWGEALDRSAHLSVAVGVDALRDAGLPLMRHYRTTSTGKKLPDRFGLPKAIGDETGVILATAFPSVEPLLTETAGHLASVSAEETADELEALLAEVMAPTSAASGSEATAALASAVSRRVASLREKKARYAFQRKFVFQVIALGHAQVAQHVLAKGPNTQVNAACASGTQALGIARDWLLLGRCKRVLVVSADDATTPHSMPWLGTAFLAAGAATTEPALNKAAVPFGAARNGMILGAGASAFVVEHAQAVQHRGLRPLAEIAYASFGNAAFHGTRLNGEYIEAAMKDAVAHLCERLQVTSKALAKRIVFMSHETYTPARGGSAAAEVQALRAAFGADISSVLIANTKGYTGHPMGASLEDAVLLRGLQTGKIPPIAHRDDIDPDFADLNLSQGGFCDRDIGLRFAAGFGSQVAITTFVRIAQGLPRLADKDAYASWLKEVSGQEQAGLEVVHRTLRIAESGGVRVEDLGIVALSPAGQAAPVATNVAVSNVARTMDTAAIVQRLQSAFAKSTGYDLEDLDPEYQLEADLGIDTVKQAEVFAELRADLGLAADPAFRLSEMPTLNALAGYIAKQSGSAAPGQGVSKSAEEPAKQAKQAELAAVETKPSAEAARQAVSAPAPAFEDILQAVTQLFAEQTGYDMADLEPEYQLEADLGIDTVKQAEIFALLRERHQLAADPDFKLSDHTTLTSIAAYVRNSMPAQAKPAMIDAEDGDETAAAMGAIPASALKGLDAASIQAAQGDSETLLAEVTALFAEHTGYDHEDLEPDFALEADLGIDTVKQAEIFAELRRRYSLGEDTEFRLSDVTTLRAVAGYVAQRQGMGSGLGVASTTTLAAAAQQGALPAAIDQQALQAEPQKPAAQAMLSEDALYTEIVALFAERTGYAVEDFEPEFELESDLGIDTVKQAELFAVLRKQYALGEDPDFKLSEISTLKAVVAYVASRQGGDTPKPPQPPKARASQPISDEAPSTMLPRADGIQAWPVVASSADAMQNAMQKSIDATGNTGETSVPKDASAWFAGRNVLVASPDASSWQAATKASLLKLGATSVRFVAAQDAEQALVDGSIETMLWLNTKQPQNNLANIDDAAYVHTHLQQAFAALQAWVRATVKNAPRRWLVLDLCAAPDTKEQGREAWLGAGLAGMAKSVAREWAEVGGSGAWLGVDGSAYALKGDAAQGQLLDAALQGLALPMPAAQMHGVLVDSTLPLKWQVQARDPAANSDVVAHGVGFAQNGLVVATGGTRGVTFEILKSMAAVRPFRLRALSRTKPLDPALSPLNGLDAGQRKAYAQQELAEQGQKATPLAVRNLIERIQQQVAVFNNMAELVALGVDAKAWVCDVGSEAGRADLLARIEAEGQPVSLLLHGAGVEESRFLADKDAEAFERVYSAKADGFIHLHQKLKPARAVAMASVSGRYGNAGQVDYAAANEVLCAYARAHRDVLSIAWTAWDGVGMATRGSVRQVLEASGVSLMPLDKGVALAVALIDSAASGEWVASGRLGAFAFDEAQAQSRQPAQIEDAPALQAEDFVAAETFFDASEVRDNGRIRWFKDWDPKTVLGLDHHRIDGTAVLPGVWGIELMARGAEAACSASVMGFRKVRFAKPIKCHRDEPVRVWVEVDTASMDAQTTGSERVAKVVVGTVLTTPRGRTVENEHYFGTAVLAGEHTGVQIPEIKAAPEGLEMARDPQISRDEIYTRYFHGPSFQVLDAVGPMGEDGLEAKPLLSREQDWSVAGLGDGGSSHIWQTRPWLRESGFQAAGLWEMAELGRMSLPSSIEEISWQPRQADAGQEEGCHIAVRSLEATADGAYFDVWVLAADGSVRDFMKGYGTVTLRDLTPEERFEPVKPSHAAPDWLTVQVGDVAALLKQDTQAALKRYLTPSEQVRFGTLKVDKRRAEWLAGRVAAKRLIREVCFESEGAIVPYGAIEIHRDLLGGPVVEIIGGSQRNWPQISISHSHGLAVALISSEPDCRVGIDIEEIAERVAGFEDHYCTQSERDWLKQTDKSRDRALAELWAVKEASLKALGIGARVDFRELEVCPQPSGAWKICAHKEALARMQSLEAKPTRIQVEIRGKHVVARVFLAVGKQADALISLRPTQPSA